MNGSLRWGLGILSLLALMAVLPPPIDPVDQVDPVASRHRPPGTLLHRLELVDGRTLLVDRFELRGQEVQILRGGRSQVLQRSAIANLSPVDGTAPRRVFLLGSDRFGRDIWSRMMAGARVSLLIAILAMALASTLGTFIGVVAATAGPRLDNLLMRGVDAALAFPSLFLVLGLSAILEPSTAQVILLLGCTGWMSTARLARGELVSLRERDFVIASRSLGQRRSLIILRHLLPNALNPLLIDAALKIGNLILAEAALSFFGLGVQAPTPSWGNMVSDGRTTAGVVWWSAFFPGLAIAVTVIAFNLVAEGLRRRLNPRSHTPRRPLSSGEESPAEDLATLPAS